LVTSRFLFNIGKTSSVLLAATLFVSGFSASQAEAAVNAGSDANGVQEASSPNKQLIARKTRKKVTKKRRTVTRTRTTTKTTVVTPGSTTTVIKENTVVTPQTAPPAPTSAPAQPQTQVESDGAVSQQEFDRLRGQVESYRTELEGVDARIQEANSKSKKGGFSTTTKLNGEVIIGVSGFGGASTDPAKAPNGDKGTILTDRVRLNFDTSFTGKDRLRTRLQSRNTSQFGSSSTQSNNSTGTNQTRLGFDGDSTNNTSVSLLEYSFPLNDSTKVLIETIGAEFNDNIETFNPLLASSGGGAISRFGRFNPIYRQSNDGAAITVNNKISDNLELSLGYAVPGQNNAAVPGLSNGLFNGSNAALAQLAFKPSDSLTLGATYARSYHTDGSNVAGGTGSSGSSLRSTGVASGVGANSPFGSVRTSANHYSLAASYKLGSSAVLSGWYGWTESNAEGTPGAVAGTAGASGGSASSSNWAATLAFPDFGNKGNVLGFVVGQSPKLNALTVNGNGQTVDSANSLHLEALYKMKVSDNVDITPGLLLITNPENNAANATEYVGTVRTTFKF
jgi:Carbohydrate-selective porin, OprB family